MACSAACARWWREAGERPAADSVHQRWRAWCARELPHLCALSNTTLQSTHEQCATARAAIRLRLRSHGDSTAWRDSARLGSAVQELSWLFLEGEAGFR